MRSIVSKGSIGGREPSRLADLQLRVSPAVANQEAQDATMSDMSEGRNELGALHSTHFYSIARSKQDALLHISVRLICLEEFGVSWTKLLADSSPTTAAMGRYTLHGLLPFASACFNNCCS